MHVGWASSPARSPITLKSKVSCPEAVQITTSDMLSAYMVTCTSILYRRTISPCLITILGMGCDLALKHNLLLLLSFIQRTCIVIVLPPVCYRPWLCAPLPTYYWSWKGWAKGPHVLNFNFHDTLSTPRRRVGLGNGSQAMPETCVTAM